MSKFSKITRKLKKSKNDYVSSLLRREKVNIELKEHLDKGGSSGDHDMEYYANFLD